MVKVIVYRCANCLNTYGAENKYCPHCGYDVAYPVEIDDADRKESFNNEKERTAIDKAWNKTKSHI